MIYLTCKSYLTKFNITITHIGLNISIVRSEIPKEEPGCFSFTQSSMFVED